MTKLPRKAEAAGFTGSAWTIKDVGSNEAQATKFEIVGGTIVKETVYMSNVKLVVLEQVSAEMAEEITR